MGGGGSINEGCWEMEQRLWGSQDKDMRFQDYVVEFWQGAVRC